MILKRRLAVASIIIATVLLLQTIRLAHAGDETDPSQHFVDVFKRIFNTIDVLFAIFEDSMIRFSRAAYSIMVMAGFMMWASNFDKRLGRDLIFGSLMLAFTVECIVPLFV